jgi:hypothetical protein
MQSCREAKSISRKGTMAQRILKAKDGNALKGEMTQRRGFSKPQFVSGGVEATSY